MTEHRKAPKRLKDYKTRVIDPIYGHIPVSEFELKIIDSQLFQRLRGIHQSGTAYMVYPTSNYSRFQHSIGVLHIINTIMNRFDTTKQIWDDRFMGYSEEKEAENEVIPKQFFLRILLQVAGLLHDICHAPFSHTTELITGRLIKSINPHEDILRKLLIGEGEGYPLIKIKVKDKETQIKGTLLAYLENLLDECNLIKRTKVQFRQALLQINNLFNGVPLKYPKEFLKGEPQKNDKFKLSKLYHGILDSDFDADTMDYLLRDSYVSGAPLSWIDIENLISNISLKFIDEPEKWKDKEYKIIFKRQAMTAIETFVIVRRRIYRWLNFHHRVCLCDELMYRMIQLGLDLKEFFGEKNIFEEKDFKEQSFIELLKYDFGKLNIDWEKPKNLPKIIDDHYVLREINKYCSKCERTNKAIDYRKDMNYLYKIFSRQTNHRALWKVDFSQLRDSQKKILKKISEDLVVLREEDMESGSKVREFDDKIKEFEDKINKELHAITSVNAKAIICFKPYKTVKSLDEIYLDLQGRDAEPLGATVRILYHIKEGSKFEIGLYVFVKDYSTILDKIKENKSEVIRKWFRGEKKLEETLPLDLLIVKVIEILTEGKNYGQKYV